MTWKIHQKRIKIKGLKFPLPSTHHYTVTDGDNKFTLYNEAEAQVLLNLLNGKDRGYYELEILQKSV